jgi:hypothetical protein
MTKQNILNAVLGVAMVFVGFVAYNKPADVTTVVKEIPVGAVVSSELSTNNFSFGEVRRWAYSQRFNVASTTLCAVKSPAATSTLVFAGYNISTGTTTAATIDVAKGNTAYATTTLLVTGTSVGSGATKEIGWTTAGGTAADDIMAPSTYVLVKTASVGLNGYTYGGRCSVVFQEF